MGMVPVVTEGTRGECWVPPREETKQDGSEGVNPEGEEEEQRNKDSRALLGTRNRCRI